MVFFAVLMCALRCSTCRLPGIEKDDAKYTLLAVEGVLVISSLVLLFVIHNIDPGIILPSSTKGTYMLAARRHTCSTAYERREALMGGPSCCLLSQAGAHPLVGKHPAVDRPAHKRPGAVAA